METTTGGLDPAGADPGVDDRLCLALHAAARAMDAVYRPLLEEQELTYPQYLVMSVLWQDGPQQVGALARRLHLESSTMSPLLKRLEMRGLVVRQRLPGDERKVLVGATDEGVRLRDSTRDVIPQVCAATGLTRDAQDDLVVRLQALVVSLAAPPQAGAASAGRGSAGAGPQDLGSPEVPMERS
ncbi:MarR family winged helix-turn-helix transcriptional regulator [Nocardioides sp. AX2bis]|uniref:MarR family winged helix-turn-helix transcriptional regulator n=1 Tax=Nocardioides sp. AX2bis TaxID=2653157 RepID=UPI0012F30580|nr:MarR family transcriptional regulator [Nocardioides sp. AX2bis]VXC32598.1 hypothetical protein NOCARDAX2BIS_520008 [Nocardioides sp. AX2bis]